MGQQILKLQWRYILVFSLLFLFLNQKGIGQKQQRWRVLVSNYQTSVFKKFECCFLNASGQYGIGAEVRFKIGDNSETISTIIGLSYFQINYKNFGDLPVGAFTKYRHQILSVPIYLQSEINKNWYLNYHLSLDLPYQTKRNSFDGLSATFTETEQLDIGKNAGMGAGLALGYKFRNSQKFPLFGELFFKVPSLFTPLRSDFEFYLDDGIKPFLLGVNVGVSF